MDEDDLSQECKIAITEAIAKDLNANILDVYLVDGLIAIVTK